MNAVLKKFLERTAAELKLSLDEVEWWKGCVARGLVKPEHARSHIEIEHRIIATKRYILGLT